MADFATEFIRGFSEGRRLSQDKERLGREQEDRELRRKAIEAELKSQRLREQMDARSTAIREFSFRESLPGATKTEAANLGPATPAPTATIDRPLPEGLPPQLQQLLTNQQIELRGAPTPQQLVRTIRPNVPVTIPGVPERGLKEFEATPRTLEEVRAQTMGDLALQSRLKNLPADTRAALSRISRERIAGAQIQSREGIATAAQQGTLRRASEGRELQLELARMSQAGTLRRANIRAGSSDADRLLREETADKDRRARLTIGLNRLLASENSARARDNKPLLSAPPGFEIARLEQAGQDVGVRRWGRDKLMSPELGAQYLAQAGNDPSLAEQWALEDGWVLPEK